MHQTSSQTPPPPAMLWYKHPLQSISARNHRAAVESETLLWRALCDDGPSAREHIEKDCVMINPLLHPSGADDALSASSDPSLNEALARLRPWSTYRMHDEPAQQVVEVDMMAVCIMHRVTMTRMGGGGGGAKKTEKKGGEVVVQSVDARVTSVWRQGAGGDWKLCAQQVVPEPGSGPGGRESKE